MSISISDIPFPVSPALAARWNFHQYGLQGVQALCVSCFLGLTYGPTAIKKLPKHTTPPELIAHVCAS